MNSQGLSALGLSALGLSALGLSDRVLRLPRSPLCRPE
ncbi:MAG: hypothetical protein F2634_07570 [Actinobacteria bacterium]|nr:hypothetical protein [Actinomycetota bacterium]